MTLVPLHLSSWTYSDTVSHLSHSLPLWKRESLNLTDYRSKIFLLVPLIKYIYRISLAEAFKTQASYANIVKLMRRKSIESFEKKGRKKWEVGPWTVFFSLSVLTHSFLSHSLVLLRLVIKFYDKQNWVRNKRMEASFTLTLAGLNWCLKRTRTE